MSRDIQLYTLPDDVLVNMFSMVHAPKTTITRHFFSPNSQVMTLGCCEKLLSAVQKTYFGRNGQTMDLIYPASLQDGVDTFHRFSIQSIPFAKILDGILANLRVLRLPPKMKACEITNILLVTQGESPLLQELSIYDGGTIDGVLTEVLKSCSTLRALEIGTPSQAVLLSLPSFPCLSHLCLQNIALYRLADLQIGLASRPQQSGRREQGSAIASLQTLQICLRMGNMDFGICTDGENYSWTATKRAIQQLKSFLHDLPERGMTNIKGVSISCYNWNPREYNLLKEMKDDIFRSAGLTLPQTTFEFEFVRGVMYTCDPNSSALQKVALIPRQLDLEFLFEDTVVNTHGINEDMYYATTLTASQEYLSRMHLMLRTYDANSLLLVGERYKHIRRMKLCASTEIKSNTCDMLDSVGRLLKVFPNVTVVSIPVEWIYEFFIRNESSLLTDAHNWDTITCLHLMWETPWSRGSSIISNILKFIKLFVRLCESLSVIYMQRVNWTHSILGHRELDFTVSFLNRALEEVENIVRNSVVDLETVRLSILDMKNTVIQSCNMSRVY